MYKVLVNENAVPPDFLEIVFDILERSSVEKFVLHIQGIKTNHDQRLKVVDLTYLLTEAENKYQEIADWNGEKVESGFNFNDGFWNCGAPNHYVSDCPHPDRRGEITVVMEDADVDEAKWVKDKDAVVGVVAIKTTVTRLWTQDSSHRKRMKKNQGN